MALKRRVYYIAKTVGCEYLGEKYLHAKLLKPVQYFDEHPR